MKNIFTLLLCVLNLSIAQADIVHKTMKRASADAPVLTSTSCWTEKESYDLVNDDRIHFHCFRRDFTNYGGPWDWGWACYDEAGNTVWVIQTDGGIILGYGFGWDDAGDEVFFRGWEDMSNRFEAKDMADGAYTIKSVSKLTGSTEWHNNLGTDACYLTAVKSGNTLTITTTKVSASLTMNTFVKNATDGIVEDDYAKIAVTVSNTGTAAYNDYVLAVIYKDRNDGTGNGDYAAEASARVSLEAGQTLEIELTAPEGLEDGATYFVWVFYNKDGEWEPGVSTTPYFKLQMKAANLSMTPTVKYLSDGFIGTKSATISLQITNNDTRIYDNQVYITVYKDRNDGTGYGDWVGEAAGEAKIEPGKSTGLELTIGNLENGGNYFVIAAYRSKGKVVQSREVIPYFTVKFSAASLQITPTVDNADENGLLEAEKAELNFHVANVGKSAYNDVVIANVYKLRNDDSGYGDLVANLSQQVSVVPGQETDVKLAFDEVEDGASYFLWAMYISNGEEVKGVEYTPFFTFKHTTTIRAANAATPQSAKGIYTLDGRRVEAESGNIEQTLRLLPKGIYIVNGKKVRN